MSGAAAVAAMWVGATAAVGGLGYSVYSGERQQAAQEESLENQKRVQAESVNKATADQKSAEKEYRAANRKNPDVNRALNAAKEAGKTGYASTILTQKKEDETSRLGSSTLIGG